MLFKFFFLSLEANGTTELLCSLFLYSSLQRNQKKKMQQIKRKIMLVRMLGNNSNVYMKKKVNLC